MCHQLVYAGILCSAHDFPIPFSTAVFENSVEWQLSGVPAPRGSAGGAAQGAANAEEKDPTTGKSVNLQKAGEVWQ
jgi:hypothetical protein